jgi:hypothetical protein
MSFIMYTQLTLGILMFAIWISSSIHYFYDRDPKWHRLIFYSFILCVIDMWMFITKLKELV